MGLVSRGRCTFYLRSVRRAGRVVTTYAGSGPIALGAARSDAEAREERAAEAAAWRRERDRLETADRTLGDLCRGALAIAQAAIEARGYHQHKRQWRRRRPMSQPAEKMRTLLTDTGRDAEETYRLLKAAQAGDKATLPKLRALFDEGPEVLETFLEGGQRDLVSAAEIAVIESACGPTDLLQREILIRDLDRTATELAGADPTPVERLLARRAALCWNATNLYEIHFAKRDGMTMQQADTYQRQIDRAHRRLLQTLRTLETVRRLTRGGPLVAVNVAQSMTVEAGTAPAPDPRPGLNVPDLLTAAPRG
jgi:hypothetical protein